MFWKTESKDTWIPVIIDYNLDNYVVLEGGSDSPNLVEKGVNPKRPKRHMKFESVTIKPTVQVLHRLGVLGTRWELRTTKVSTSCIFRMNITSDDTPTEVAESLRLYVLDSTRPCIFVPRKSFIKTEEVLQRYFGRGDSLPI